MKHLLALRFSFAETLKIFRKDFGTSEGAKFWLGIMNELHHRRLKDILMAVIDGLMV